MYLVYADVTVCGLELPSLSCICVGKCHGLQSRVTIPLMYLCRLMSQFVVQSYHPSHVFGVGKCHSLQSRVTVHLMYLCRPMLQFVVQSYHPSHVFVQADVTVCSLELPSLSCICVGRCYSLQSRVTVPLMYLCRPMLQFVVQSYHPSHVFVQADVTVCCLELPSLSCICVGRCDSLQSRVTIPLMYLCRPM